MTKATVTLLAVALSLALSAQNAIDTHYSDYNNSDEYSHVSISAKMFELFTHLEGETAEEKEILESISKLKGMKMIVGTDGSKVKDDYTKALKRPDGSYEDLMVVKHQGEEFTFKIRETSGVVRELLMIGYQDDQFYIMSLFGEIDLRQIHRLAAALEIDGMQHLEKIEAE